MSLWRFVAMSWIVFFGGALIARAEVLSSHASEYREQLQRQILPYWYDTARDTELGGYLLADDQKGRGTAREKQLVSQARMVWGFSHVARKGMRDPQRDYLAAARLGYQFLVNHFQDRTNGGYFWKTDRRGQVTDARKYLYGEAFVVYAFVEYFRASGDTNALQGALALFHDLQTHAHDAKNRGWREHFTADWNWIQDPKIPVEVEVAGCKSANAHLHWMEALTELSAATQDREVNEALAEALELNRRYFYPKDPARSAFHFYPDWQQVTEPRSQGLSYGHNVEFAWLMIRAEEVLRRRPSWSHFRAHVDHALQYGYDWERGGIYNRGIGNQPANQTDKVWWAHAELLAALSDGMRQQRNARYEKAADQLIHFIRKYQTSPDDNIWYDTVTAEGVIKNGGKAHAWKANYHDVRAMVKFIENSGLSLRTP